MKKLYLLVLLLSVILIGCTSNSSTVSNEGTKSDDTKPTVAAPQITAGITKTVKEDETEVFKGSKRHPEAANYSFMIKTLTSLDDAEPWGDSLDLRENILTNLDLTNEFDRLSNINYDTATKWPDKLPQGFDPDSIMETCKNPGLGIRNLHESGITGNGVNVAIIDYPLLLEHVEYCNQIKFYDEINVNSSSAEMHSPFVTSLCVGKSTGVAPDAGVYYIANHNYNIVDNEMKIDFTYDADSINELIEINNTLPEDQKIRAISISQSWCPENKGYKEITQAVNAANKAGIFVISCNMFETYGFWAYALDKEATSDPDKIESYKIFDWDSWLGLINKKITGFQSFYEKYLTKNFKGEMLLIPIGSRTTASPTGINDYCFLNKGGWSAMEPYIAGLYAMACQVKPDVTPELFWVTALETGESREVTNGDKKYPARMLNPEKLITKLQE